MTRTIEISSRKIDPNSLKLVQERIVEAYADTVDGRKVVYVLTLTKDMVSDQKKLSEDIEFQTSRDPNAHVILDDNAVVYGDRLWRRGDNPQTVRIVTSVELDMVAKLSNLPGNEPSEEMFNWARQVGVWKVIKD